ANAAAEFTEMVSKMVSRFSSSHTVYQRVVKSLSKFKVREGSYYKQQSMKPTTFTSFFSSPVDTLCSGLFHFEIRDDAVDCRVPAFPTDCQLKQNAQLGNVDSAKSPVRFRFEEHINVDLYEKAEQEEEEKRLRRIALDTLNSSLQQRLDAVEGEIVRNNEELSSMTVLKSWSPLRLASVEKEILFRTRALATHRRTIVKRIHSLRRRV
ncbi:hypothetical protein PFISCL1PPCAC_29015, partial [Pristionchus fissidentatus]